MDRHEAAASDEEAARAWALLKFNWLVVATICAALALGLALTNFHVTPVSYTVAFLAAAIYGLCGYRNATSANRRPHIFVPLSAIAQTILVVAAMTSISYIAIAAAMPLRDAELLAIDRAMGLDFRSYLAFINDRPWLAAILNGGYGTIVWPVWVVAAILPLAGHHRRAAEFVLAFALALIVTIGVAALLPALGVYSMPGLAASDFPNVVPQAYYYSLQVIPLLRDGSLRTLDLFQLGGVLTFPSFHAASAILYAWSFWPVRWLRSFNLVCGGAMIVATPVFGGHYFVDVIAGVGVAIVSICVACRAGSRAAHDLQWRSARRAASVEISL